MSLQANRRAVEVVATVILRKPWIKFFREIPTDRERGVLLRAYCDFIDGEDTSYMSDESEELRTIYRILCAESEDSAERYIVSKNKRFSD